MQCSIIFLHNLFSMTMKQNNYFVGEQNLNLSSIFIEILNVFGKSLGSLKNKNAMLIVEITLLCLLLCPMQTCHALDDFSSLSH